MTSTGVAAFTLIVVAFLGGLLVWRKKSIVIGQDNRVSTSKTTAYAWTLFVAGAFATLLVLALSQNTAAGGGFASRLADGPGDQYLLLLGGPFAALVGAKGIVSTRTSAGTLQKSDSANPTIGDLYTSDDKTVDLVDTQFLLFNALALAWCVVNLVKNPELGLPQIPSGMAALTSVAALAYLGNKAVARNTPMVTSVSPTAARRGDLLTITGRNFTAPGAPETDVSHISVTVAGLLALIDDGKSNDHELAVVVPEGAPDSSNTAVVVGLLSDDSGTAGTTTVQIAVVPDAIYLDAVEPGSARPGDSITLRGRFLRGPRDGSLPQAVIGSVVVQCSAGPKDNTVTAVVPAYAANPEGDLQVDVLLRRGALVSTAVPVWVHKNLEGSTAATDAR